MFGIKGCFFFYFFVTKFFVFILAKKWMRLQVKLFVIKFFVCVDFLSLNLFFFRCWYACLLFCMASLKENPPLAGQKNVYSENGKKSYLMWSEQGYFGHVSCTF